MMRNPKMLPRSSTREKIQLVKITAAFIEYFSKRGDDLPEHLTEPFLRNIYTSQSKLLKIIKGKVQEFTNEQIVEMAEFIEEEWLPEDKRSILRTAKI